MNDTPENHDGRFPKPKTDRPFWAVSIALNRRKKNLSQRQLADKLKASQTTVASWETGQNQPSLETFQKIANALDIRLIDLVQSSYDLGIISDFIDAKNDKTIKHLETVSRVKEFDKIFLADQMDIGVRLMRAIAEDLTILDLVAEDLENGKKITEIPMWKTAFRETVRKFIRLCSCDRLYELGEEDKAKEQAVAEMMDELRMVAETLPIKRD